MTSHFLFTVASYDQRGVHCGTFYCCDLSASCTYQYTNSISENPSSIHFLEINNNS